jgi:cytochrome c-type biogenesis protein CcmE
VVVGHFASYTSAAFVSNSILIKHSSTYTAQYPNRVKVTSTGPAC